MSSMNPTKQTGRPAKDQKPHAIELIKAQLEQTGKVNAKEIAQATGYEVGHIRRLAKKVQKQKLGGTETLEPETEGETVTPDVRVESVEAEEIPEAEVLTPEGIASQAMAKGFFDEDDIFSLFDSVNSLFPEKYRRDEKATRAVSKAWVKPFNRLLEKYADENVDLYIAVAVTVMYFAPSAVSMMRDRMAKPKTVKEDAKTKT